MTPYGDNAIYYILNQLKHKLPETAMKNFLDQIIWSEKTYPKYGWSLVPDKREMEPENFAFCPFVFFTLSVTFLHPADHHRHIPLLISL